MRDSKRAVQSTMYKRRERDTGRAIYSCTAVQYPSSAHLVIGKPQILRAFAGVID